MSRHSYKRLEVDNVDAEDLTQRILVAVAEAVAPLAREVQDLRRQLHGQRGVITHKEATAYFAHEVKTDRVLDFIKGKNLPQGVTRPLPANKVGNVYFIRLDDLFAWQAGTLLPSQTD